MNHLIVGAVLFLIAFGTLLVFPLDRSSEVGEAIILGCTVTVLVLAIFVIVNGWQLGMAVGWTGLDALLLYIPFLNLIYFIFLIRAGRKAVINAGGAIGIVFVPRSVITDLRSRQAAYQPTSTPTR
jgi:hypothetical protein